jgi:hypothetical protein
MATAFPAAANRAAKDGPAWPVPMMMASKCCDTLPPFEKDHNPHREADWSKEILRSRFGVSIARGKLEKREA